MLKHGNLEVVVFLIWCFIGILIYCSIGSTPGFEVEGRMKEQIKPCKGSKTVELVSLCRLIACCFFLLCVPKMNSFRKSSTITSVPIKACQAFSPAGETTFEKQNNCCSNSGNVLVVSPMFHVSYVPDLVGRKTRLQECGLTRL